MQMDFFSFLAQSIDKKQSLLCVGLDPQGIKEDSKKITNEIVAMNRRIIEETLDFACCFKPNIAFYECHGYKGLEALDMTLDLIPPDVPVILDSKRSDIGNTAEAYARAIFNHQNVHATTLNPYLGKESVLPFLKYEDKGLFLLCRTSNPGAHAIQELEIASGSRIDNEKEFLYEHIAQEVCSWGKNIGLVVAGNDPVALKRIRTLLPDVWILAPGIGTQGGDAEMAIANGIRDDGYGLIINVSRDIAQSPSPKEKARFYKDKINDARVKKNQHFIHAKDENRKNLALDIIKEGCFKTGVFTLKSGKISPFYIDLRLLISNPRVLARVADAYCRILQNLDFKRVAGIPFAGIPIATCIAQKLSSPMIFPRLEKKAHGSGNIVEGAFVKGEKVVLIDDLITTGKSKFEALDIIEQCGLVVSDLVVLIERGISGKEELAGRGVTLHSCFHVSDFIRILKDEGTLAAEEYRNIMEFLEKNP